MRKIKISEIRNKKILAVGAHPDDVEFGAGGTLLQLGKGSDIYVIVVSDGQMGSHDVDQNKGELVVMRQKEAREAARMYQARQVIFFDFTDTRVQEEKKRLVKKLVKRLVKWRPDLVISHDPWRHYSPYHPDHRAVGLAVLEAVILATLPSYLKRNKLDPKLAIKNKPEVWLMHPQERHIGVDVSEYLEEKLKVLEVFGSQFDEQVQWQEIKQKLTEKAEDVGEELGVKYAEAFARISGKAFSGVEG